MSLCLKGIGSVGLSRFLYGPDEGSISDFLSQKSVWAETADICHTPPWVFMAKPYLWPRGVLGPANRGAWGATVGQPWSPLAPGKSLWLAGTACPWQGSRVLS